MFPKHVVPTLKQQVVLNSKPNLIVYGPAGSGKSLLAILLAEKLAKIDTGLIIEIIVFTKSLNKFILEALNERGVYNVIVRHTLNDLIYEPTVDISIIDEGQDFRLKQINLIRKRSRLGVYIFGDKNQNIYEFDKEDIQFDMFNMHLNFHEVYLEEVIRYGSSLDSFIKNIFPKTTGTINHSYKIQNKPHLFRCSDNRDQAIKIFQYLKSLNQGSTAILVPENKFIYPLLTELENIGLEVNGFKFKTLDNLSLSKNAINILTYHSAKGLEFDNVVIPNIDSGINFHYNLYYVGFSRAKVNLGIFYIDEFPAWIKLNDSSLFLGELYRNMEQLKEDVLCNLQIHVSLVKKCLGMGLTKTQALKILGISEKEVISETAVNLLEIGYSETDANQIILSQIKDIL